MCGIIGIYHPGRATGVSEQALRRMLSSVVHRGPDGQGLFQDGSVLLGHRRLSIIDLASGAQPMSNEDRTIHVCANGEIFNYRELTASLASRGHRFRTSCDIEVILHLYEEHGLDMFEHMEGQFAFALWDAPRRRLVLARDRFGIAPLYYAMHGDTLIFASEVKAMLPMLGRLRLSPEGMAQVFTFWSAVAPRTVFEGVYQLRPGQCMVFEDGVRRDFIYWDVAFPPDGDHDVRDEEKAMDGLREILDESASLRLRSDVPVGAYLSGGLDSSVISVLVKKYVPGMETFSVSFADPAFDESLFQETMGQSLGTHHHVRKITYEDIGGVFEQVVWHTETPVLRSAPAPMFLLSELTRAGGIKVVLTGEGADELFGGYDIFKEALIRRFWSRHPDSSVRPLLLYALYPHSPVQMKRSGRLLMSFYREDLLDTAHFGYSHLPTWRNTSAIKQYFTEEFRGAIGAYDPVDELAGMMPEAFPSWHPLNQAQYLEIKLLLAGYLLSSQGERMTMAHGVEGRYPFLSHRLAEYASRLDPRLKLRGLKEKYILKRAFRHELPGEIFSRVKQPYGAPNKEAFFSRGSLRPEVAPYLARDAVATGGIFDPDRVDALIAKCSRLDRAGFRDNSALMGVLSTQMIMKQFC
ncbi:MAG TPA: asparagine synthase (glutamine-hydrolyzing) [Deltaproteobacteria bacterium]|nr:asparagine synthase (glutamine-hydrolyzing) [Deltaproteobacteria bacterium]